MKRTKVLWWGTGLALAYAGAGFLVAPLVVKGQLEQRLSQALQRQVSVEAVRVNPFAPSVTIRNLAIQNREGEGVFAGFGELYVNAAWTSVLRLAPVVDEVTLAKPVLNLRRGADRRYNFQDLLDAPRSGSGGGGEVPKFAVFNILVSEGRIEFDDRAEGARHEVTEIRLGIPHLSSLPAHAEEKVRPELALKVNGAPLSLGGDSLPFDPARPTHLAVNVEGFDLTRLVSYLPAKPQAKLASALADAKLTLGFDQAGGKPRLVLGGEAAVRELALLDPQGAPLVSWQRLRVELNEAEPLVPRVDVKSVELSGAQAHLHRDGQGVLNFSRIVPAAKEKPSEPTPTKPFPLKLTVGTIALDLAKLRFTDDSVAPALDAVVGQAQVRASGLSVEPGKGAAPQVALEDLVLALSGAQAHTGKEKQALVSVDALELKAQKLSTAPGTAGNVALIATVGKGGSVAASGPLTLEPFSTRLALDVKRLGLVPAQRYVDRYVHLAITSGAASAKGTLAVEAGAGRPLKLAYKGSAGLYDFASVDKRSSQDLLKWKALALDGIDFDLGQKRLSLDAIALSDYYARVIVSAEGRVNLQDLAVESQEEKKAARHPRESGDPVDPPFRMRIGKLALQGGNVNFSDFFIRPNYSANLTGVGGAVTEMRADKPGDVELRGKIDNAAPVEILGRINPLAGNLFLDIKASARDIELAPLSPYSVKYAGYGIERGKLSLNVKYHIEDRKLVAENQVYLDQLTFGDKVESPTATSLPVTFAVALLKDRNGVIDLNLPISGSLDDPQFSLFGIIAKVVGNLIVKAITAPFALLGALFGGGEELSFLEFEPGAAALDPQDRSKLGSLAKALSDRPALKLDITGRAEPALDREGLKRASVAAKVRARKFEELRRAGKAPASAAEVTVEPAEYERFLRQAYSAEKFPKPRNALGFEKELPVGEMETLMLTHAEIDEDDLRLLANARAQSAKEWLTAEGKVAAERVFIIAPKLTPDGIKDTGKPTRVDFSLK